MPEWIQKIIDCLVHADLLEVTTLTE